MYDPLQKSNGHIFEILIGSDNCLVLDGQTLVNLEVLQNTRDGGIDGTLLKFLDHTVTPFGKRLFKVIFFGGNFFYGGENFLW